VRRFDFSLVVLVVVLALMGGGVYEMARAYPDAGKGLVIYAREQKDLFVDAGLVEESKHVRAPVRLAEALRYQTVIVAARTSEHRAYVGAGVIVAERRGMLTILTAKHILAHPGQRFVIFRGGVAQSAQRVVFSKSRDLALVFVRPLAGTEYSVARVASDGFTSGQQFVVMGHPGAQSWTASPGVAERHLHDTLLFCPTCDRGDSGAGAFDRSGALRGIVVSKAIITAPSARTWRDFTLTAFEIERPEAIRAFLREHAAKG
jgi:S1-C subfamily serine protease